LHGAEATRLALTILTISATRGSRSRASPGRSGRYRADRGKKSTTGYAQNLDDLKDKKLRPAVGRLNQHLSTLVAEQPSDPTLTPGNWRNERDALRPGIASTMHGIVHAGADGLYERRRAVQTLRTERDNLSGRSP